MPSLWKSLIQKCLMVKDKVTFRSYDAIKEVTTETYIVKAIQIKCTLYL